MIKSMEEVKEEYIQKRGFNPLVTTQGSLNMVDVKKAAELNKLTLDYLAGLARKDKK